MKNWYYWQDEEYFHGPYVSREAAIKDGKKGCDQDYVFYVQQAETQDYNLCITGDSLIEILYGQNEDLMVEGEFIDPTKDQEQDLGEMVTAAIYAWVDKHKINTQAWALETISDPELIA